MNDKEATDMMQRCKHEIIRLRQEIDHLRPRAEAYDSVSHILALLPQRGGMIVGEDVVWTLDKRIREIEQNTANSAVAATS